MIISYTTLTLAQVRAVARGLAVGFDILQTYNEGIKTSDGLHFMIIKVADNKISVFNFSQQLFIRTITK